MKITLDAFIKEHREIGLVLGIRFSKHYKLFIVEFPIGDGTQFRVKYIEKVTIDLDQAQMDLRMAIGTGVVFRTYTLDCNELPIELIGTLRSYNSRYTIKLNSDYWASDLISIEENEIRLCPDYLKSVGVEVEE